MNHTELNPRICNLTMERAILGCCVSHLGDRIYPDIAARLEPRDFFDVRHGLIWSALSEVFTAGQALEPIAVFAALGADNQHKVGQRYVIELLSCDTVEHNISHYVSELVQLSAVRATLSAAYLLIASLERDDASESMPTAEAFSATVQRKAKAKGHHPTEPISAIALRGLQNLDNPARPTGLTATRIEWLDKLMDGGYSNALHVIAARPSQGKTALATQIAVAIARQRIGRVLFFCCEMDSDEQFGRMVSQQDGPPALKIKQGWLNSAEKAEYRHIAGELGDLPLEMFDGTITVERVITDVTRAAREHGKIAGVFVDYYQRIKSTRPFREKRDMLVHVSNSLADLARTHKAPVFVLSQLNRKVEGEKRKPLMSDLSECSELEADAYSISFPYLPARMGLSTDQGEALVLIGKNRGGTTGNTGDGKVRFQGANVRFQGI